MAFARSTAATVYPRWRGEHLPINSKGLVTIGLSPLARGTRAERNADIKIFRFIPAGAGNTVRRSLMTGALVVYPRWRGEHTTLSDLRVSTGGLSPLARGTHHAVRLARQYRRFIPAGAGNTVANPLSEDSIPVYPRWRGEHIEIDSPEWKKYGLSPLARGTPYRTPRTMRLRRFIPAGAGNTSNPSCRPPVSPVYPRWRGEHMRTTTRRRIYPGLSPLARGTRMPAPVARAVRRFIPAGAGNTSV